MIIRRLADGIRKQDWSTVLVEILVVVVGIFLGLQVDDWNEARKDRELEGQYAIRLVQDLDNLRRSNNEEMTRAAARVVILKRAFQALTSDRLKEDLAAFKSDLQALDYYPFIEAESSVIAELISTGNIGVISDPYLRAEINSLATVLENQGESNQSHFRQFLLIRGETHRGLDLVPTNSSEELILGEAEDFLDNPQLKYVLSFSIELFTVQQKDWERTDARVIVVREQIAETYGLQGMDQS